jgi:hypothetical protein
MLAEIKPECKLANAELDRQFGRVSQLSGPAQKHLHECKSCRALYSYFAEEIPPDSVSREAEHKIVRTIQGSLKPVSRLGSTAAIAAQVVIVFLVITAAITSRMKVVGLDVMTLPQLIGISTVLLFGAGTVALSLAWQMRPGSLGWIPGWASVAIVAPGLVVIIFLLFPWKTQDDFVIRGWHCLRAGLALAVPAALVFGYLAGRGAPLSLRSVGSTVGAIAGLLAVGVLQYTCDLQNIGHLVVWHVGVLVVSILAGAIVGECLSRFGASVR